MDLILMARRSRHYAGTRYLKRGLNVSGKVANDCEVEQILQYDEGADIKFCSYVQMRGSIPTYWHQETSVTMPKPPILINRIDPDYLATQEHFSGTVLSLILCRSSSDWCEVRHVPSIRLPDHCVGFSQAARAPSPRISRR